MEISGRQTHFSEDFAVPRNQYQDVVLRAAINGQPYKIQEFKTATKQLYSKKSKLKKWHKRYGHLNENDLKMQLSIWLMGHMG